MGAEEKNTKILNERKNWRSKTLQKEKKKIQYFASLNGCLIGRSDEIYVTSNRTNFRDEKPEVRFRNESIADKCARLLVVWSVWGDRVTSTPFQVGIKNGTRDTWVKLRNFQSRWSTDWFPFWERKYVGVIGSVSFLSNEN